MDREASEVRLAAIVVGPPERAWSRDGRTQEEDIEGEESQSPRFELGSPFSCSKPLPAVSPGQDAARRMPDLRLVQRSSGSRDRLNR